MKIFQFLFVLYSNVGDKFVLLFLYSLKVTEGPHKTRFHQSFNQVCICTVAFSALWVRNVSHIYNKKFS